jgi:hypothetical protein
LYSLKKFARKYRTLTHGFTTKTEETIEYDRVFPDTQTIIDFIISFKCSIKSREINYLDLHRTYLQQVNPKKLTLNKPILEPSAAILDSQVKTTETPGICGDDAAKKVKGRKRHILVDTQGILLMFIFIQQIFRIGWS